MDHSLGGYPGGQETIGRTVGKQGVGYEVGIYCCCRVLCCRVAGREGKLFSCKGCKGLGRDSIFNSMVGGAWQFNSGSLICWVLVPSAVSGCVPWTRDAGL